MFNDRYGLTDAVLCGRKTMTRRVLPKDMVEALTIDSNGSFSYITYEGLMKYSSYKVGKEIAIAQSYKDAGILYDEHTDEILEGCAGWTNKMFVASCNMPHRIRITDIRVERLQNISDEDCLREGIKEESSFPHKKSCPFYFDGGKHGWDNHFSTPREAFAALIDKVSGKGTWESNPYVWVYSFELIK